MKCPFCSYEESKVIDSRSADDGERIRTVEEIAADVLKAAQEVL